MTLTYNSHDFEIIGACGNPEITYFDSQTDYAQNVTERGVLLLSRRWGAGKVSFDVGITGTATERRAKLSTLASWLNVDAPKNLVLPDTPTWFYKAIPDGQITSERGINGEIVNVSFTLTDPVAYGELRTASFSSDSPASFVIGGNYPTMPEINVRATPDSTSKLFGIRFFGGDEMDVYMGSLTDKSVYFYCEERRVSISGVSDANIPNTITLGSKWFKFTPSQYTRDVTVVKGTGTNGTIIWRERWL